MVQKNTTLARDTIDVLAEDEEVPLLRSWLGSRSAYRECQLLGGTVHRVPRAKDAIFEVDALVDEVIELVSQ
jgi:chromosome partitioning protein